MAFQIALLGRAERLVEQNFSRTRIEGQHFDFISFARADEQRRIRGLAFAGYARHGLQACSLREQTEFLQTSIKIWKTQINAHQKGKRSGFHRRIIRAQVTGLSSEASVEKFTARPGTMVEIACL